jgi:UTP--glucose-1-phosphate uridylyltransferase
MLDEIVDAGIEEIAIVIRPGQSEPYLAAAESHASRLVFCEQDSPRGYGDAILRAEQFVEGEPFLHLVSDHIYVSRTDRTCAAQLCEVASRNACAVSAVQPTRENQIVYFGTVGGTPVAQHQGLYEISRVLEKPTPTVAEQQLIVAGQRAGYYLCMFGMHVLTPTVMELLRSELEASSDGGTIDLSTSLNQLPQRERYLACEIEGSRYNMGFRYGHLIAQLAIALNGVDRDQVLTELVTLMADR